jgi:hypothetical protein
MLPAAAMSILSHHRRMSMSPRALNRARILVLSLAMPIAVDAQRGEAVEAMPLGKVRWSVPARTPCSLRVARDKR